MEKQQSQAQHGKDSFLGVAVNDFDRAIINLGVTMVEEALKSQNPEHKFRLINAIVSLRSSLPPFYFNQK